MCCAIVSLSGNPKSKIENPKWTGMIARMDTPRSDPRLGQYDNYLRGSLFNIVCTHSAGLSFRTLQRIRPSARSSTLDQEHGSMRRFRLWSSDIAYPPPRSSTSLLLRDFETAGPASAASLPFARRSTVWAALNRIELLTSCSWFPILVR